MTPWDPSAPLAAGGDPAAAFAAAYQREFGFVLQRPVVVDDVRVRATGRSASLPESKVRFVFGGAWGLITRKRVQQGREAGATVLLHSITPPPHRNHQPYNHHNPHRRMGLPRPPPCPRPSSHPSPTSKKAAASPPRPTASAS
jgi:hypothetical protein